MGAMVKLHPAFRITCRDGWPPLSAKSRQYLRRPLVVFFFIAFLVSSATAAEKPKGTASADQLALITRATERESARA